jgi:hypothetical protein
MTKHSPGPWHLNEIVRRPTFVMAGLQCVCEIAHPGDFSNPSPDAKANARLISASPDLLAALEALLEDAIALGLEDSPYSGVVIQARNAIKKATKGA